MKKPVGRLLYPNTGWYFAAMLLFTAAAAAVGQYILAGGALFVTLIMFIISRARLSRRKRQLMSYVHGDGFRRHFRPRGLRVPDGGHPAAGK